MKKIILYTQRFDEQDSNLHVHVRWATTFAECVDQVVVIAQSVGQVSIPSNVTVHSLGKDHGATRWQQMRAFFHVICRVLPGADAFYALMIPRAIIFAAPLAWWNRVPMFLWYTSRHDTCELRLAYFFVKRIFTASSESCPIRRARVVSVGHAIDTQWFAPVDPTIRIPYRMVSVSRITSSKGIDRLISFVGEIHAQLPDATFEIVGGPTTDEDRLYVEQCQERIRSARLESSVWIRGPLVGEPLREAYQRATLFLHDGQTGGIDKAVLEAMACGTPVLVSNPVYISVVPISCFLQPSSSFVQQAIALLQSPPSSTLLHEMVATHHELRSTLHRMISSIEQI